MATSPEPIHQSTAAASAASKRGNGVLLAGFLCSFTPVVVFIVSFVFGPALFPATPADNYYAVSDTYNTRYLTTILILAAVSAAGSVSAMIIGYEARRRTLADPAQAVRWRVANTIRILGTIGLIASVVLVPCAFCSLMLSNYRGG